MVLFSIHKKYIDGLLQLADRILFSDSSLAKGGCAEVAELQSRCRLPILPNAQPGAEEMTNMAMAVATSRVPTNFVPFISSILFTLPSCAGFLFETGLYV
jgi:hypothetical protein